MIPFLPPAILALSLWLLTKDGEPARPPQEVRNAQPKLSAEALAGVTEVCQAPDGGRYRYFKAEVRKALGAAFSRFALQPVVGEGKQPVPGLYQLVPYAGTGVTAKAFCEQALAGGGLLVLASHAAVLLGKPGVDVMLFVQPLRAKARAHADGEWAVLLEPAPRRAAAAPPPAESPAPTPAPEPLRTVVSVERAARRRKDAEEPAIETAHAGRDTTNGIAVREVPPASTEGASPDAAH